MEGGEQNNYANYHNAKLKILTILWMVKVPVAQKNNEEIVLKSGKHLQKEWNT